MAIFRVPDGAAALAWVPKKRRDPMVRAVSEHNQLFFLNFIYPLLMMIFEFQPSLPASALGVAGPSRLAAFIRLDPQ